jgi:hypothetical protein
VSGGPALTPVTITRQFPGFRSGRMEKWEAVSIGLDGQPDGEWLHRRLEEPTTPWEIEYLPTGQTCELWRTSLDKARAATADGTALQEIGLSPAA